VDASTVGDALGEWMATHASGRLSDQLALAFTHAIDAGLLPAGTRLPAERDLANALAVSRPTLRAAFADLRARGLIGASQGSGTWIAGTGHQCGRSFADAVVGHAAVNLAASVPWDAQALAERGFRLTTREIFALTPGGYGTGLAELREIVASRASARQLPTTPANIAVTPGAQRALLATLELITSPGDRIIVEREAYPGTFDVCEMLRLIPVPVDFHKPDGLDRALARRSAAAALLQPIINNPTGGVLAEEHLAALARTFDRRRLPVVENNVLADLRFDGHPPRGFAERCGSAPVFTIGSLSKTIWGGLRVGWVRAPEAPAAELRRRIHRVDLGISAPSQLIAAQVLHTIDDILVRRRGELARKAALAREQLAVLLPSWRSQPPQGGLSLWVELPVRDTDPFVEHASGHGVDVLPGRLADANRRPSSHIRLSFDRPKPMLYEGIERLAAAWATYTTAGPAPKARHSPPTGCPPGK
jgi:DNA-binding transcriptional MocR family regulator